MAKLVLDDLTNINNQTSAVNTINQNNSRIETALEKTLSRDGTTPNEMNATLDMNSNRIINLPKPITSSEPVRLEEVDNVISLADGLEEALENVAEAEVTAVNAANTAVAAAALASSYSPIGITLSDLLLTTIDPEIDVVTTTGFYVAGDGGGATLKRVGADPGHTGAWPDVSGEYFEIVPENGRVNLLQFGAKILTASVSPGTGFDSTEFVHAAWDFAKARDLITVCPAGAIRVTSGYDNSTDYNDIKIEGVGFSSRRVSQAQLWKTSTIILDNADSSSYLLNLSGNNGLYINNIILACAQTSTDRKFIRLRQTNGQRQVLKDVAFKLVNLPIVWESGSYFQYSYFENVHFLDSGTFATEPGTVGDSRLLGTGLILINVGHDGSVPENTSKIVMDLSGIRHVQGTQVLLEGLLLSSGWTIYKHESTYDDFWPGFPIASYLGYWSEFVGSAPSKMLDLDSGRYVFYDTQIIGINPSSPIHIGSNTRIDFTRFIIADTSNTEGCFVRADNTGHVFFDQCTLLGTSNLPNWFTRRDVTLGSTSPQNEVVQTDTQGALCARWDGGYFDGTLLSAGFSGGGGSIYPSTDTTYGRKMVATPPSSSDFRLAISTRAERFTSKEQITVVAKVKLPTFTGGTVIVGIGRSSVEWGLVNFSSTSSAQTVDVRVSVPAENVTSGGISFYIYTTSITGLSGDIEIYALEFHKGSNAPRAVHSSFPRNIYTHSSSIPTAGAWVTGDFVANTAPAISGGRVLLGWSRLTTGSGHVSGTDWAPVYADSP